MVFFLFLVHLGIGIGFTLPLVSRDAGVKFFRFNAGLAAALIAVGLAFRPASLGSPSSLQTLSLVFLGLTEAALVVYWATIGRALARWRPLLVWTALVGGAIVLMLQGLVVTPSSPPVVQALTVASFLSSAALLGGTCTAMILGHWYLILPSMEVSHLQSIVKLHMASMVVRIAVVGAAVFLAIVTYVPGGVDFRRYIFSVGGIFFWQRVLFGLAGPAVLSYLTWETAKIRSTQSATGILYVDFFTVVVGEVLAKYLTLATKVPV